MEISVGSSRFGGVIDEDHMLEIVKDLEAAKDTPNWITVKWTDGSFHRIKGSALNGWTVIFMKPNPDPTASSVAEEKDREVRARGVSAVTKLVEILEKESDDSSDIWKK